MNSPKRASLGLFDCACIIVGVIIGSGIYRTSGLIAASSGSPGGLFGIWILGGLIALNGALCYAEIVTGRPHRGGDYAFLNQAYGPWMGFLFAWTEFWIIRPANVGAMAFVYAEYAQQLYGWGSNGVLLHAVSAIVVLSLVNLLGLRSGAWAQNVLTVLKVGGLLLVFAAAMFASGSTETPAAGGDSSSFKLALILVLFTYGGWNDVSYVAAEVRNPKVNLPRCLLLGTGLVIGIYLLTNAAFLRVLGYQEMAGSRAVAADMMTRCVGPGGARAMSLLICVSCLGAISAMIFTGSRIYQALGSEYRVVGWLAHWSSGGAPTYSLLAQSSAMLALVFMLGSDGDGFERLLVFAAPFFWLFFSLVSVSLFIFRFRADRQQRAARPYSAPLYPLCPVLFVASCLFMLYASGTHLIFEKLPNESLLLQTCWTAAVVCSGIVLWLISARKSAAEHSAAAREDVVGDS